MELLVAMGLLGLVAGFFVTLIVGFSRLGGWHARWSGMTEESFKLAELVRGDVRRAESVRLEGGALTLGLPEGERVRYVHEGGRLKRVHTGDGTPKREYHLACKEARWEIASSGRLVRGELVLAATEGGQVLSTFPVTIIAARTEGEWR